MINITIKLFLVGMQLPEKYRETFIVLNEGPSSGVSRRFEGLKADFQYSHEAPRSSLRVFASN